MSTSVIEIELALGWSTAPAVSHRGSGRESMTVHGDLSAGPASRDRSWDSSETALGATAATEGKSSWRAS